MNAINTFRRIMPFAVLCTILVILTSSCSRRVTFLPSTVVPAAEGKVKFKKDNNRNNAIEVKVSHLAEPEKLVPPRRSYVVWMETEENTVKNLGQLRSSSGLFSRSLKGSLNTVTPFNARRIFITAEADPVVIYPYGQTIMTTRSF